MSGSGQYMEVRIKKNGGAYGAQAGASGAKLFTRAQLSLDLDKAVYKSARIRPSQQTADSRHGTAQADRVPQGRARLHGVPGPLRRGHAQGVGERLTSGALTNVTAAATAPHFVRAAGSWITDGFRVGKLVRPAGWTTTAPPTTARTS
jgi:hypothetical protein